MKWKKEYLYSRGYDDYYSLECPCCGYKTEAIGVGDKIKAANFCENCGENMEGEEMALTKAQELAKVKKQNVSLLKMVNEAREKVAGYEQIAKVHSAYISLLLEKLGATKDNMITITAAEVTEALTKYEARAMQTEDGYSLYCEVIE